MEEDEDDDVPGNVVVQFSDREGAEVGEAMDVPTSAGSDELGQLLRSLLEDDDDDDEKTSQAHVPYAFFAKITKTALVTDPVTGAKASKTSQEEIDITDHQSLAHFLKEYRQHVSAEHTLELTYQPLALFKVRPVTRCADTLPGHTEAILHVTYSPDGRHLASGGGDATVRFWDVHTSTPRHTCRGHKDHVLSTVRINTSECFLFGNVNSLTVRVLQGLEPGRDAVRERGSTGPRRAVGPRQRDGAGNHEGARQVDHRPHLRAHGT